MKETMGSRICHLRKEKSFSQEALSEKLGVSPQAVSKWENDQTCPDISLLPKLAKILDITVDELLTGETNEVRLVPTENRKRPDELVVRIRVDSSDGTKVKLNLPLPLLKEGLPLGMGIASDHEQNVSPLKALDPEKLLALVEAGAMGRLLDVRTDDGTIVEVVVE